MGGRGRTSFAPKVMPSRSAQSTAARSLRRPSEMHAQILVRPGNTRLPHNYSWAWLIGTWARLQQAFAAYFSPGLCVFSVALVGVVHHGDASAVEAAHEVQRGVVDGRLEVRVLRVDQQPHVCLRGAAGFGLRVRGRGRGRVPDQDHCAMLILRRVHVVPRCDKTERRF